MRRYYYLVLLIGQGKTSCYYRNLVQMNVRLSEELDFIFEYASIGAAQVISEKAARSVSFVDIVAVQFCRGHLGIL